MTSSAVPRAMVGPSQMICDKGFPVSSNGFGFSNADLVRYGMDQTGIDEVTEISDALRPIYMDILTGGQRESRRPKIKDPISFDALTIRSAMPDTQHQGRVAVARRLRNLSRSGSYFDDVRVSDLQHLDRAGSKLSVVLRALVRLSGSGPYLQHAQEGSSTESIVDLALDGTPLEWIIASAMDGNSMPLFFGQVGGDWLSYPAEVNYLSRPSTMGSRKSYGLANSIVNG